MTFQGDGIGGERGEVVVEGVLGALGGTLSRGIYDQGEGGGT